MSPEQIRGAGEVDQRTDVYAFGVILYEALTGRVPFDADSYAALVLEIATGTPRRPREVRPELPRALEDVVLKAMARDAERRYASVDDLAHALESFAHGVSLPLDRAQSAGPQRDTATPFVSEAPVQVPVRRSSLGLVVGAALALVGVAGWALLGASHDDEPEAVGAVARPAAATPGSRPAGVLDEPLAVDPPLAAAPQDAGAAAAVEPSAEPAGRAQQARPVAAEAPRVSPARGGRERAAARRERRRAAAAEDDRKRSRRAPAENAAPPDPARRAPAPSPTRAGGRTGGLRADQF